jgi:hypothetical protein
MINISVKILEEIRTHKQKAIYIPAYQGKDVETHAYRLILMTSPRKQR